MDINNTELWLMVFASDTLRYLIGVGLVSLVLFGLFRKFSLSHRIQSRRASGKDILREFSYSILTTAVYATVALVTVRAEQAGYLQIYSGFSIIDWIYAPLSLVLLLVLHDAYFYWAHRMMHLPFLFRHLHRVHHLSRTPTSWAAYAFAPGEAFLMALYVPSVTLFLPVNEVVMLVFLAIMILRNAGGHSGVEFHPPGWIDGPLDHLTTVTHHDLHHQRFQGNYGLYFTWWDRWMGTEFGDYHEQFRKARAGTETGEELPVPAGVGA